MKILSISSDRKVFEKESAVRARLLEYGQLAEEMHVIVFAKRTLGLKEEKIASNVYLYPTNSFSKFTHICSAISRARALKRTGVIINLVTAQDPFEAGLAGWKISHFFRARLHIQIHTDFMSKYFVQESFLNRVRVMVAKFIIAHADGIRVVSERIKRSIEKLVRPGTSIAILPILIAEQTENEVTPDKDLKIKYPQFGFHALIVSRLAPEKNISSAIHAIASVIKKNPKVGLTIVGDGPEKPRLEKLANDLGVSSNVIFEGWIDNPYPYYKTADVLILPSFYEGYGMAAIEASMAGCPVVMTDVGCAGGMVMDGQNGLIVPVGDTAALTRAIERIASGGLKFDLKPLVLQTKEEYLAAYKRSWQNTLDSSASIA